ncbi:unnamed protein product [Ectocarpus sp. CCAP 1310/34]|nr:unnamed protein product [Ectocarpus sp. CCAP 1310/34]
MNKLLELKPDAVGGMPANAKPEEALAFKVKLNSWYQRFRKRNGLSIRRRTSVGQKLPQGYEGMAWATVMKLREALVKRAGEIYARRHPPAPDESPIKGEDLTSEQLLSIRRRTSVGQKLPQGYEGMAWATVMKLREALVKRAGEIYARRHPPVPDKSPIKGEDLTSEQLASVEAEVFEELGNMDQTPVQHEMPVETTLEKTGAKDARISTGGGQREGTLHARSGCHGGRQKNVSPRIIFQGTPFIPPTVSGKGKSTLPRKNSVAWEIHPANRAKHGHPANGMSFGVQEKSWSDQRECNGWISGSWKLRPNNGSIVQQRPCILVLDDFKCHKDEGFIAALKRDANTIVIFTPGGLTPLLQPLDRTLNKQMKRLLRGNVGSSLRGGRKRGSITPETVKTCFKICGLTLALDGSEDHAWCEHNFGEDYRDLLEEQHAVWLAEHPDVTLPPLKLPKVPRGFDSNPITAAQKEVEGKLLPYVADESGSEVEVLEGDSDVEVVKGQGGGGAEGEVVEL